MRAITSKCVLIVNNRGKREEICITEFRKNEKKKEDKTRPDDARTRFGNSCAMATAIIRARNSCRLSQNSNRFRKYRFHFANVRPLSPLSACSSSPNFLSALCAPRREYRVRVRALGELSTSKLTARRFRVSPGPVAGKCTSLLLRVSTAI